MSKKAKNKGEGGKYPTKGEQPTSSSALILLALWASQENCGLATDQRLSLFEQTYKTRAKPATLTRLRLAAFFGYFSTAP